MCVLKKKINIIIGSVSNTVNRISSHCGFSGNWNDDSATLPHDFTKANERSLANDSPSPNLFTQM